MGNVSILKAVQLLQHQLDQIDIVLPHGYLSQEFRRWTLESEQALTNIFGKKTSYLINWNSSVLANTCHADHYEVGLSYARAILQAAIQEIEKQWIEDYESKQTEINTNRGANVGGNIDTVRENFIGRDSENIHGDNNTTIQAERSQGLINSPSGPVTQNFVGQVINEAAQYIPNALHQLRPIPPSFIGRIDEIGQIIEQITENKNSIIVIEGMAGVGKTTLANFVGHVLTPDFPDAQFFIALNANSPMPLTPRQAFIQCLYSLYPEAQFPNNDTLLRNMYLSALQGKRAIIILDDARDDEHIELLMPPAGCITIVTSRRSLENGLSFMLKVLPRRDAVFMLQNICPRINSDEANQLAILCGDLPIALQVAAGHLKVNKAKPVTEYIQSLQSTKRIKLLEKVHALFAISYQSLSPTLQSALRSLSIMPTDFNREAGIALIEDNDSSSEALDELLALNLLQFNEKSDRYFWHDLLRKYIQSFASAHETNAAKIRHLKHFTKIVQNADKLYQQGRENISASLNLFDAELAHIRAALQFAYDGNNSTTKPDIAESLILLIDALTEISSLRFHPREWAQWLTLQLEAARATGQLSAESRALANLGFAYMSLGEVQTAIDSYEQSLKIAQQIKDRKIEGLVFGRLGFVYFSTGDIFKAISSYKTQLDVARDISDRRDEGIALNGLGMAYYRRGELSQAIGYYEQSLRIRRDIGDRRGEATVLTNLGAAYATRSEISIALEHYEHALNIQKEIGDRFGQAKAFGNLGNLYVVSMEMQQAIEHYKRQLDIAHEIGNPWDESSALGNIGLVYAKLGNLPQAIEYYQQQLVIVRQLSDREGEATSCFNVSLAYKKLNNIPLAKEYAERSVNIFRAIESPGISDAQNWLDRLVTL